MLVYGNLKLMGWFVYFLDIRVKESIEEVNIKVIYEWGLKYDFWYWKFWLFYLLVKIKLIYFSNYVVYSDGKVL